MLSLVDKGWQVHAMESGSCHESNELREQLLPVGPGEASTSNISIPHESVSSSVPDSAVAGTQARMSVKVIQIIVFGVVLAAALMAAILWILHIGQHRTMYNSMKGFIARSYDGWDTESGQGLQNWMRQVDLTDMHSASTESGSLPLCRHKHLPRWTRTCVSMPCV
jgi:hypothetical protein